MFIMINKIFKISIVFFFFSNLILSQDQRKFKIQTIAFYNVENLFDTINDVNKMTKQVQ